MEEPTAPTTIWGLATFYSETGTEGGYWAVQDHRAIDLSVYPGPGSWSRYGLVLLKDGDTLTIYDRSSVVFDAGRNDDRRPILFWKAEVLWEGQIRLGVYDSSTERAFRLPIHHDVEGVDRETWARWFMEKYPCRLVTRRDPWPVGVYEFSEVPYQGILPRPSLRLMSDGTTRWRSREPYPGDLPPYEFRRVAQGRGQQARTAEGQDQEA